MLDYDSNAAVKRAGGAFGFAYASMYLGLIYSDIFTAKNVPPPPPNIPHPTPTVPSTGESVFKIQF